MKKATIIFNPIAGKGKTKELTKYLEERLLEEFDSVEILATKKPKDAIVFATNACLNGIHSIFAIGGDGTINEVVQGIMDSSCEKKPILGTIPGGTFNGVSRIMEFSQNPRAAIDNIDFNKTEFIDIGRSNNETFNMIYSIGDVPESLHNTPSEEKSAFSVFAYAINIARDAVKNTHYHMNISVNDLNIEGDYSHVVVMLSTALSKLTLINKGVQKNDGYLHLFILKESSLFEKIAILPDLIGGN
ncbi:MAG: hypothetical protein GX666_03440, partial [Tissierellia bacterium]|nr:hypothetical protein [Tissierellia bacterium]